MWGLSITFWCLHLFASIGSTGHALGINLCKYGHCISIALSVKNIVAHPICWIKSHNSPRHLLQYAHVPLSTVSNLISLSAIREVGRFYKCSHNSSIVVGRYVILFLTKLEEEAWAQCLMVTLSKKYLKKGCFTNLFSRYLRRCFAYSWRCTFCILGCNQSTWPLRNNVGNAISNNPSVLYSFIGEEPMLG